MCHAKDTFFVCLEVHLKSLLMGISVKYWQSNKHSIHMWLLPLLSLPLTKPPLYINYIHDRKLWNAASSINSLILWHSLPLFLWSNSLIWRPDHKSKMNSKEPSSTDIAIMLLLTSTFKMAGCLCSTCFPSLNHQNIPLLLPAHHNAAKRTSTAEEETKKSHF